MKVIGIVCSPRRGGNTETLMQEALEAASAEGAETKLITVAGKKISPCDGCEACKATGECRIDDDMQEIYRKFTQADGVIFGTPVYYMTVTAQAKIVMDRLHALWLGKKLSGKVAGIIVVQGRTGAGAVLGLLYTFFTGHRMLVAGGAIGYGREKGEVKQGVGGVLASAVEEARTVGRNVVRLIRQRS